MRVRSWRHKSLPLFSNINRQVPSRYICISVDGRTRQSICVAQTLLGKQMAISLGKYIGESSVHFSFFSARDETESVKREASMARRGILCVGVRPDGLHR